MRTQTRGRAQRGFGAFFTILLVAGLAASAGLFTFFRHDTVKAENERATAEALAAAKAALIGYAVHRGGLTGPTRPGELPCPDLNGDGLEDAPCRLTSTLLGRIPWKTLGIPEPKDGARETLWYALSSNFRAWNSFPVSATASQRRINSDSRGNITVRGPDGTTLTTQAVAVVFAPGASVGNQNRGGAGAALCALTNTVQNPQLCPANYLESATGVSGLTAAAGPFTAAPPGSAANDRLAYVDTWELIPALEMRVGLELKALLEQYRQQSNCNCYPWADTWPYSGGIADIGQNRGRFPSDPFPEAWGSGSIPRLPDWVAANDWHNLAWYSVARQNSEGGGSRCRTCTSQPMLTINDHPVSALVLMPGSPVDGRARLTSPTRRNDVTLYYEDASNQSGASTTMCPNVGEIGGTAGSGSLSTDPRCDQYVSPTAELFNRDRLFAVGSANPSVCAPNAQALADAAPCGWPTVSQTCLNAREALDSCTCLDAARTLTRPPCVNSLNPPQCEAAMTRLKACTI